jgi:hypothetical protein
LVNGFVSSSVVRASAQNGLQATSVFTGSYNAAGASATPLLLQNTLNSTDLYNTRQLLIPSRGYNAFNNLNVGEWNNTIFPIDTTPAAGAPVIIVGNLLQLAGSPPYSGQFWLDNRVDGTPLATKVYQNIEGVLSTIGLIAGNTVARVFTANSTNWSIQSNVSSPNGTGNVSYPNFYQVQLNSEQTTVNSAQPLVYNMPTLTYFTNKTLFFSPQIRVVTIDAPSFNSREAGFEATNYFDASVVFTQVPPASGQWQSDAFNPIVNYSGNSFYSFAGWQCQATLGRFRTDNDVFTGYELTPTAYPVGGGAIDFIWGTARFVRVNSFALPSASLREDYLLIPKNYYNFNWVGQ